MVYVDMSLSYGDGALFLAGDELSKAFIPLSRLIQPMFCPSRQRVKLRCTSRPDFSTFVRGELMGASSPALAGNAFAANIDYSWETLLSKFWDEFNW